MARFGRSILLAFLACLPLVARAEEFLDLDINSIEDGHTSLVRSAVIHPKYHLTSPWQAVPGSYRTHNASHYNNPHGYSAKNIYSNYLVGGGYSFYSPKCANFYGKPPQINNQDMDNAFDYAASKIQKLYSHKTAANKKQIEAELLESVSEYFGKYKCMSKYQTASYLPTMSIKQQYTKNRYGDVSCTPYYNEKYECKQAYGNKYRTIDGSCNNQYHPYWGRSNTCHIRLIPADYSDGVRNFRVAHDGHPLPPPRLITNKIALSKDFKSYYTTMVLAIGQFVNHDIANTEVYHSQDLDCCVKPNYRCVALNLDGWKPPGNYKSKCFNFVRSASCPLCKLGPSEQLNSQTSFIDLSLVYGPNEIEGAKLRTFKGGLLAVAVNKNNKPVLPVDPHASPCTPLKPGAKCFAAGDNRANQHPLLLSLHVIFLRIHNHHATQLARVNPTWDDNKLYHEARRISIAEYQHVIYNEYLPVILGPILTEYYSLRSLYSGNTYYEPYTDPSSWNDFSASASRYGHSQIKDYYKILGAGGYGNKSSLILLKDNFFEPGFVWDDLVDDVVRGLVADPSNTIDPYYSETAKNYILKPKNKPHGIDLVSVNILRGRDHGLPGYVNYLKACFNYEAKTWKDLERFIPVEVLAKMQTLYSSIYDIDFYMGGISEKHFIDANIGPTFSCLVGIQFYHLKFGDRYFYEHGGQAGSFTPAQLSNIRETSSLAHILCLGTGIKSVQSKVLYLPSNYNAPIDCSRFPKLNYGLWKGSY